MKLIDVIKEVNEDNMSKDRLESLHTRLSTYLSELQLFSATLEKEEAMFMAGRADETVASRKVGWRGSVNGQKLIGVKSEISAVKPLISSVKSRLYNFL